MKFSAIHWVIFTTVYGLSFAVIAQFDVSLTILLIMLILGFILIPLMVYKVLTDNYSTRRTFADWYEDDPRQ